MKQMDFNMQIIKQYYIRIYNKVVTYMYFYLDWMRQVHSVGFSNTSSIVLGKWFFWTKVNIISIYTAFVILEISVYIYFRIKPMYVLGFEKYRRFSPLQQNIWKLHRTWDNWSLNGTLWNIAGHLPHFWFLPNECF